MPNAVVSNVLRAVTEVRVMIGAQTRHRFTPQVRIQRLTRLKFVRGKILTPIAVGRIQSILGRAQKTGLRQHIRNVLPRMPVVPRRFFLGINLDLSNFDVFDHHPERSLLSLYVCCQFVICHPATISIGEMPQVFKIAFFNSVDKCQAD